MNTLTKLTNLSKESLHVCLWRPGEIPEETAEVCILEGGGVVVIPHEINVSIDKARIRDLRIDKFTECACHKECDCTS